MPTTMMSSGFPPPPKFTKNILIGLLGLYVVELLLQSWIGFPTQLLGWHPSSNFELYQPFTCYLVQGQQPLNVMMSLLMVYFFFPSVQKGYGKKGLIKLLQFTFGIGTFWGALMIVSGAVAQTSPFMGLSPFITASLVVFGLKNPRATILLFFILPIQAAWIAWGTGLFALLNFLFGRTLGAAMICGGWLSGFLFMKARGKIGLKSLYKQFTRKRRKKKISQFRVIDGGKRRSKKKKNPRDDWH